MNKTEKIVLEGIRDSLREAYSSKTGDTWETYANRLGTVILTNVKILSSLLSVEEDESIEDEKGLTL